MLQHCKRTTELAPSSRLTYRLVGPEGPITAFNCYCDDRVARVAPATLKSYSESISQLIDFLYHVRVLGADLPARRQVKDAIDGYISFMLHGEKSRVDWVRDAAKQLPHDVPYETTSITTKLAALNDFLLFSEDLANEAAYLLAKNLGEATPQTYENFVSLMRRAKKLSGLERSAIHQNSVLGGVVRESLAKSRTTNKFSIKLTKQMWDQDDSDFPIEEFPALIRSCNTSRDKAFVTLLFGSGIREHEGLNLKFTDIDFDSRRVFVNDPNRLRGLLTHEDRGLLRFKGRNVSSTFFIPLFTDLFFEYLHAYLLHERPHLNPPHEFIFTSLHRGPSYGAPYHLSDDSTRLEVLHGAQTRAGIRDRHQRLFGNHSFRHAYGIYMVNYLPLGDERYGLPIEIVQRLMGHEKLSSTQRYARHDVKKIDALLKTAELLYSGAGISAGDFHSIKADFHMSHLRALMKSGDINLTSAIVP